MSDHSIAPSAVSSSLVLPPLSLYVHVPWCVRKCPYCDFNSHAVRDDLPEAAYLKALFDDLAVEREHLQSRSFETVFIGGGTPSLMSADFYQQFIQRLNEYGLLVSGAEITMEANPGTFEQERFAGYRSAGINRLSLGIQSFNDQRLHTLGRIHSGADAKTAAAMALELGFDRVNLDLMHGLPGQGVEGAMQDLEQALALDPGHLSWYQLTIEPNTEFHSRPPQLPFDDDLAEIQDQGQRLLASAGYAHYEISAFAKEGHRAKHNLNYWTFGDYAGVGAGAHAKLTTASGSILRRWKQRQPKSYMNNPAQANSERLLEKSLPLEFMMNVLRLSDGVSQHLYAERTGQPWSSIQQRCELAQKRGLLDLSNSSIKPTPTGRRFLNDLLEMFLD